MARSKRQRKGGARKSSSRYVVGQTTRTTSDTKKIKKQKEYRRKKLSQQKRRELLEKARHHSRWVVLAILLVVTFNLVQIKESQFTGLRGLSDADRAELERVTDDYISGMKRIKFFFEPAEYQAYLLENASFLHRAEVSVTPFSSTLSVRVTPKSPAYAFIDSQKREGLWVAEDGSLIKLTEEQLASLGTARPELTITDSSSVEYQVGDPVTPVTVIDFMRTLKVELALQGLVVSGYEINDNPREIIVSLEGEKYDLWVSIDRPIESMLGDLQLAQQQMIESKKAASQYIDLRVIDKVFYR